MDPHVGYPPQIDNPREEKKPNATGGVGNNQVFYQQQQPSTSSYPQQQYPKMSGTAGPSSSRVMDAASRSSSFQHMPGADDMNDDFLDFFADSHPQSSSNHLLTQQRRMEERVRQEAAAKKADEDLQTLMESTSDMKEIQQQILLEQDDMDDKYKEERSRQRRAAAARSRYQRMSENERRQYNHRRRMRQLGLDPETGGSEIPNIRAHVREANAKKAEAARLRYHRMTPEQKRDYNMRRTEAFRRRRQEEEQLLSTPAGRISAEALAKAQQIMIRNARKAESARLRYQKMSTEERKQYNMKRAAAKKSRKLKPDGEFDDEGDVRLDMLDESGDDPYQYELGDEDDVGHDSESDIHIDIEDTSIPLEIENGSILDEIDEETSKDHMLNVINEVAHPRELGIFTRMENEVMRRTRIANATIQKQQSGGIPTIGGLMAQALASNTLPLSANAFVGGVQYDIQPGTSTSTTDDGTREDVDPASEINSPVPVSDEIQSEEVTGRESSSCISGSSSSQPEKTHVIDEKALQDMVQTGCDANGLPVEIRTCDGTRITTLEDLINISHGQTVLITQTHVERKDYNVASDGLPPEDLQYDANGEDYEDEEEAISPAERKVQLTRARRAERARARYHRMSQDQRREQNAKRALTLRKSRARDDQLCQLAEQMPPEEIDAETAKAIREAQQRRSRRAEQARTKYHKMNSEQRRKYNAARDAQRRVRRSEQEANDAAALNAMHNFTSGAAGPNSISVVLDEKPNVSESKPPSSSEAPPTPNIPTYSSDGSDYYNYEMT